MHTKDKLHYTFFLYIIVIFIFSGAGIKKYLDIHKIKSMPHLVVFSFIYEYSDLPRMIPLKDSYMKKTCPCSPSWKGPSAKWGTCIYISPLVCWVHVELPGSEVVECHSTRQAWEKLLGCHACMSQQVLVTIYLAKEFIHSEIFFCLTFFSDIVLLIKSIKQDWSTQCHIFYSM